jgi:hypothetical protein
MITTLIISSAPIAETPDMEAMVLRKYYKDHLSRNAAIYFKFGQRFYVTYVNSDHVSACEEARQKILRELTGAY